MAQSKAWDKEYQTNNLVTNSTEPQNDFKKFIKFLRKEQKVDISTLKVLDLGSGTGKNSIFLAERGANCTGLEISDTAIGLAKKRAAESNLTETTFIKQSFGETFPFSDATFDLALDIMSSNSLTEAERALYLEEVARTLKPQGFFFVRLLALDGDKHAQTLIKDHPGAESGTYVLPEVGITERVLTRDEFIAYYSPFFNILKLEKNSSYAHVKNTKYKRHYWVAYLQKK
tara:strand:- start:13389 stop:14078 length:690 start_codon:yes stop_codon:yes gene_type:complete